MLSRIQVQSTLKGFVQMKLVIGRHLSHLKFYNGDVERGNRENVVRNISYEYEQVNITCY